jgi:hypothetical protein
MTLYLSKCVIFSQHNKSLLPSDFHREKQTEKCNSLWAMYTNFLILNTDPHALKLVNHIS